ncbi:hypothetical protein FMEXI_3097 [Fusarium mexicanum]|uniref:(S)-ureidoglycine aminohydrolase cupin domain-containing protein n=1 Tax=Fusarium mexicanum TaxID=751941 RepID=A0A8H5N4U0_9HYPO|nr:hypothetical protein FMEXI_3097 [Fusarium mexicanum]
MGSVHQLEHGSRSTTGTWVPFEWEDPVFGQQSKGEVVVIRSGGTSGSLSAGLWRTGPGIAGCNEDGTCDVVYSAPLGDETMLLLEGSTEATSSSWHINGPFLKKFWVMWNGSTPGNTKDDLIIGNINDNPQAGTCYSWEEPGKGQQQAGEFYVIRDTGSTGSLEVGLWRTGRGMPGCDSDGSVSFEDSATLGDETIMLLEGLVTITERDTGKTQKFQAGDIIALPSGLKVTWTSEAPFVKTYYVITSDKSVG